MTDVKIIEAVALLTGLVLTSVGAFVAAKAVIINKEQAEILSGTYYNGNNALKDSLLNQSRNAKYGLWLVGFGTILQIVGTALSFL